MPSIKRYYNNNCRANLKEELRAFPEECSSVASTLGQCTFKKTRYTSHINFLSFCLKHGVIPIGFKIRFQPSLHGKDNNGYQSKEKKKFSRKLMRTTLSHMCRMRDELSVRITDTRTTLRLICANNDQRDLYNSISHLIHTLNSDWLQYPELIKENKLQRLTTNSPE